MPLLLTGHRLRPMALSLSGSDVFEERTIFGTRVADPFEISGLIQHPTFDAVSSYQEYETELPVNEDLASAGMLPERRAAVLAEHFSECTVAFDMPAGLT